MPPVKPGPRRVAAGRLAAVLAVAVVGGALAACDDGRDHAPIEVSSTAFGPEETIPVRHTCDGDDVSFPLLFEGAPEKTQSFAVIMDEPEAIGGRFTHWVVWGISGGSGFIGADQPKTETPGGSLVQGVNDAEVVGYSGPCPDEEDSDEHRYVVRAYALNTVPQIGGGATRSQLKKAIEGHIVGYGELVGYYEREN